MPTKAIVTLIIGNQFKENWNRLCRENWQSYADRHQYDIVLIDQPLDDSLRARKRSPAWQKCLIFEAPQVKKYKQIVWMDSDILFNPTGTPSICDQVPEEKVGAVDSFVDPSLGENQEALKRWWKISRPAPDVPAPGEYRTPEDVYRHYGPQVEPLSRMLNAGMLVASPKHHAAVFRHVYDSYEDQGSPSYYENVPLSYELVKRDLVTWMDPRFNHLYAWSRLLHYPFVYDWRPRSFKDKMLRRLAGWMGNDYEHRVDVACATTALLNCYCLHFAGCAKDMTLVDMAAAKEGRVRNLGVR